jgi:hypothetical protein
MSRKGFFTHTLNGQVWRMNRHGVVMSQVQPDTALNLPGFGRVEFAPLAISDAVKAAAQQAGHKYRLTGSGWNISELWNF